MAQLFVFSSDELLPELLDVVVECAGHFALTSVYSAVLYSGTDLLIASVGALADAAVEQVLYGTGRQGGAKLRVPAGESPRILRRRQHLRRWSHEQQIKSFFTRSLRTRCTHGVGAPW